MFCPAGIGVFVRLSLNVNTSVLHRPLFIIIIVSGAIYNERPTNAFAQRKIRSVQDMSDGTRVEQKCKIHTCVPTKGLAQTDLRVSRNPGT